MEFAEAEFKLGVVQPDGATLREHYENLLRQKGVTHELLEASECPDSLFYIWEYFLTMNIRRTGNGYGPNPLTPPEVEAWARLHGVRLTPFEAEALDGLETRFLKHFAKAAPPS